MSPISPATLPTMTGDGPTGLWARLKTETRSAHAALDSRIGEGRPFASRDNYGRFLLVQHDFHALVSELYHCPDLAEALMPDLAARDRFAQVVLDLADLGIVPPARPTWSQKVPRAEAIGWLYVAEGSNLGAAFLLRSAQALGLSEAWGARHLAGSSDGRGLHWRQFTGALDALGLDEADQAGAVVGATNAFNRVRELVEQHLPLRAG